MTKPAALQQRPGDKMPSKHAPFNGEQASEKKGFTPFAKPSRSLALAY